MFKNLISQKPNPKYLQLLGFKVRDKVTGYEGVVSSISFDLYGCVQAVVIPRSENNEVPPGHWFDVDRLEVVSDKPVMEQPNFFIPKEERISKAQSGACAKPVNSRY